MSETRPWEPRDGGLRLRLRVTPRSRHPGIEGVTPDADGRPLLVVKVTAPPAEGAANAAVVALMAKALGLPRSAVMIASGASARIKTLHVEGPPDTLARRLEDLVSG
ncbi:DUF167 family protein [Limibaculum sp. FT325]|uniref:DUF167 family protein n=1 Tax=Thermohalobaculum sediminis TaxID=2939436 RepID=UPI0020C0BE25|nr:DUF167 family protein [Limibaculum sediminis]MCL5778867.1 DUF167 family protein [Limibaculum sediminis]